MALVRRSITLSTLESHRDIAGFVYATIGVIYAVLLAFVCIATWERYAQASDDAVHEASTVTSLHELAQGLPSSDRDSIDNALLRYVQVVINDEWSEMARREQSPQAERAISSLWTAYQQLPEADRGQPAYGESLHEMTVLEGQRGQRLDSASGQIPRVVWAVLIFGAVIAISYTYLFGIENFWAQALITAALTITVSGVLVLTFILDDPFRGDVRVRPDSLRVTQQLFVK